MVPKFPFKVVWYGIHIQYIQGYYMCDIYENWTSLGARSVILDQLKNLQFKEMRC